MTAAPARIGVLALQGDFAAHEQLLARLGCETRFVKHPGALDGLDGLVLPGGESTTLLRHFERLDFIPALRAFAEGGGAFFATCAGVILLAREVSNPVQPSLALADVDVERNAYGRQGESFETDLPVHGLDDAPFHAVFIRAPAVVRRGAGVEVLAEKDGRAVLLRDGRHLLCTFHPELTADDRVHRLFLAGLPQGGSIAVPAAAR